jgi:hypothetical protein
MASTPSPRTITKNVSFQHTYLLFGFLEGCVEMEFISFLVVLVSITLRLWLPYSLKEQGLLCIACRLVQVFQTYMPAACWLLSELPCGVTWNALLHRLPAPLLSCSCLSCINKSPWVEDLELASIIESDIIV